MSSSSIKTISHLASALLAGALLVACGDKEPAEETHDSAEDTDGADPSGDDTHSGSDDDTGASGDDTAPPGDDTGDVGDDTGSSPADNDGDGFDVTADCDDGDPAVNPDADEVCDEIDNDCDGAIDTEDDSLIPEWYVDFDGDAYGDEGRPVTTCEEAEGIAPVGGDCDDTDADIHPGAPELCDEIDSNCDGVVDEDLCVSLADAEVILVGEAEGDFPTHSSSFDEVNVGGAGDINGDGCEDFYVGSPFVGDVGAAYLLLGCSGLSGSVSLADADARVVGGLYDGMASGVAAAGDLDGDGYDDLLVGAFQVDAVLDDGELEWAGAAYVFQGPISGDLTAADAAMRVVGDESDGFLGKEVAGVGDVTGDGLPDIAVGSDYMENWDGAVCVYSGLSSGEVGVEDAAVTLTSEPRSSYTLGGLGSALSGGDVDGDGVNDLLVGARNSSDFYEYYDGAAYLFLGPLSGTLEATMDADVNLSGRKDEAGQEVSIAEDVDGDGYPELAIGSNNEFWLIPGDFSGAGELDKVATVTLDEAGSVAGRDLDGDGFGDLVVGVSGEDLGGSDAGAAWVVYGPVSGILEVREDNLTLIGAVAGDAAGEPVGLPGDVDGDGLQDLLITANGYPGGDGQGAVYLIFGSSL
jgi:hypothetical protein